VIDRCIAWRPRNLGGWDTHTEGANAGFSELLSSADVAIKRRLVIVAQATNVCSLIVDPITGWSTIELEKFFDPLDGLKFQKEMNEDDVSTHPVRVLGCREVEVRIPRV